MTIAQARRKRPAGASLPQAHSAYETGAGEGKFPPLPTGVYDIIYADPPWDYKGQCSTPDPAAGTQAARSATTLP